MKTIEANHLKAFYGKVFRHLGLRDTQADIATEGLFYADINGIDSHGAVNLARIYVSKLFSGEIVVDAEPCLAEVEGSVAVVNGARAIGFASAAFAMDQAIDMAERMGSASVGLRYATHAGVLGFYVQRAVDRGLIGIAATNLGTQAIVAPPGTNRPIVGTNVLTFGIPANTMPPFILDMSTAAVSTGKIRVAARRGEMIPPGWLFTPSGEDVTDPSALDRGEALLAPIGGRGSWYKGFGLALFCELICSALTGAASAPVAATQADTGHDTNHDTNIGLWFLVIRPPVLAGLGSFTERVDQILQAVIDGGDLTYPGKLEHETSKQRFANGIPIDDEVYQALTELATEMNITL